MSKKKNIHQILPIYRPKNFFQVPIILLAKENSFYYTHKQLKRKQKTNKKKITMDMETMETAVSPNMTTMQGTEDVPNDPG